MKTVEVYVVMCKDMDEIGPVMVFDDMENAEMYIEQIKRENEGCGFGYYIEDSKAILINK